MSNIYSIKLQTGENLIYSSLEDVLDIMRLVQQTRTKNNPDLIKLKNSEGATLYLFPDAIIGYSVVEGNSLENIIKKLEEEVDIHLPIDAIGIRD